MTKSTAQWVVVRGSDIIIEATNAVTKEMSISLAEDWFNEEWDLMETNGFKCIRVEMREVSNEQS